MAKGTRENVHGTIHITVTREATKWIRTCKTSARTQIWIHNCTPTTHLGCKPFLALDDTASNLLSFQQQPHVEFGV